MASVCQSWEPSQGLLTPGSAPWLLCWDAPQDVISGSPCPSVVGGHREFSKPAGRGRSLSLCGSESSFGELGSGLAEQPFLVASFSCPDQAGGRPAASLGAAQAWPQPSTSVLPVPCPCSRQLRWRLGSRGAQGHSVRVPVLPQRDPRWSLQTGPCDCTGHRSAQCN